jgi:hypothetical protein
MRGSKASPFAPVALEYQRAKELILGILQEEERAQKRAALGLARRDRARARKDEARKVRGAALISRTS